MEDITIKALNPDDDSEVIQIIRLFERAHRNSFPLAHVYEKKFWKVHAGSRFTSLIALEGPKVIAHLAIRPDRDNPRQVQLYLPVCDPVAMQCHPNLHQHLRLAVERQAQRQGWGMLYSYVISDIPEMHYFASELFCTHEVAVWPFCLPPSAPEQDRRHVLVTQRMLTFENTPGADDQDTLYVPQAHRRICEWLYAPLGPARCFSSGESSNKGSKRLSRSRGISALPADRRAIETRSYRQMGITVSCVEPGLLANEKKTIGALKEASFPYQFVSANMRDPKTPEFCGLLEENGYRFCGVLPLHRNKENIVYYNLEGRQFGAKSLGRPESVLAQYLESYSFSDPDKIKWKVLATAEKSLPEDGIKLN